MNRKIFYAITAAVFFIFALTSLGGCGGGHSSSFSGNTGNGNGNNSNPTQDVSELDGKTFASSAKNVYSGTAVDNDGNEFNVSLSRFIVGFSNVSTTTASEISTAAVTGSVAVSYIFEVETSVDRYAYNFKTVELINTSNDYKFSFNDVEVTVNPSSKNIIVDGAFYVDGKLYTLNEPFTLAVTEKSSDEEDESTDSEPRYVLIGGEFADKNEYSGDLTPFVNNRITERLYMTDMDNVITTLESLKKGDFLFFTDADDSFPDDISIADLFRLLSSLYDAYDEGVAFVTVHAISGDVEAMNEMLKLSLEYPDDNAPYPFFELLGVAKRPLSNGSSHVFTYTATCTGNQDYFDNSVSVSDDSYVQEGAEDISVDSNDISDTSEVDPEEFYKTLCEARVQALFDWEKGLDEQAAELDESVSASVAKFKTSAGLGDELMSIATGMTSYVDDHFSMNNYDYIVKYLENNPNAASLLRDLVYKSVYEEYQRALFMTRDTHTDYRVISFHSFDTHKDYYLVTSKINTQPKSINGACMLWDVARFGFTKTVYSYLWPSAGGNHLERYLPDQTVNRSRSYTDSSGWSVTNATTVSNTVSAKIGFSGENPTGEIGDSFTVSYTNSKTASHNSSTTWTVDDYEVVPAPYNDGSNRRRGYWELRVTWPSYTKVSRGNGNGYGNGYPTLSTAAGTSVTLDTEAIFSAELSQSENFKIYGQAAWGNGLVLGGFGYAKYHSGATKTLNMVRPLHTAVTAAAYDGNRDNKQYLGVFNAEDSWTAESNVDWLELAYADPSNPQVGRKVSGNSGGTGIRINYQAQENNTGRMRIGIITIKSGKDKVYIPFTQSAAGIN